MLIYFGQSCSSLISHSLPPLIVPPLYPPFSFPSFAVFLLIIFHICSPQLTSTNVSLHFLHIILFIYLKSQIQPGYLLGRLYTGQYRLDTTTGCTHMQYMLYRLLTRSTLHWVVQTGHYNWMHAYTIYVVQARIIYNICCTGSDHATFKMGWQKDDH